MVVVVVEALLLLLPALALAHVHLLEAEAGVAGVVEALLPQRWAHLGEPPWAERAAGAATGKSQDT